jgi:hypothetical protein
MGILLGGEPDSGSIQIGKRDERLFAEFGADATGIKLDRVLDAFAEPASRDTIPDNHSISSWIAAELPGRSTVCRQKEAHVLYNLEHERRTSPPSALFHKS